VAEQSAGVRVLREIRGAEVTALTRDLIGVAPSFAADNADKSVHRSLP